MHIHALVLCFFIIAKPSFCHDYHEHSPFEDPSHHANEISAAVDKPFEKMTKSEQDVFMFKMFDYNNDDHWDGLVDGISFCVNINL